jgi:PAS domain S-box-containing protein
VGRIFMPTDPKDILALRRKAEKLLSEAPEKLALTSRRDLKGLVHELSVHQIELEMQNEELRSSREQLERSRSEYAELYDFAPAGYLTFDKRGLITRANLTVCGLLGVERSRLVKKPFDLFIHPESQDLFYSHTQKVFEATITQSCELVLKKKDGTFFDAQLESIAVQVDGRPVVNTIVTDITERKRLEDQLCQARKMEAVGTLAGGVAHDFNNILTVIMGLASLIQMSIEKDDTLRQRIDQIVASSARAADLTQSLLAFSRTQWATLEPRKVNGVVKSTAKLLTRLLPEEIRLMMNLSDEDMTILLDVTQIGQVLMNLATNARDAMPQGGSLTLTTERARLDESFKKTHGFGRMGEYVRLSVSDTGTGMDEKTMERIFEPFFTTKEVGKGTGLGLASAYGIVKQHNGYITASSSPFKGTTFDIYLPLITTPSPQEAPMIREIKGGAETILIVENDRDVRHMLARILESHGYTIIEAVDGDDAIRVHREHKDKVDLIILDVVMSGKYGKEALAEIARTAPRVKAIFTSGYTGDVVIDKGIQSESVDLLKKPLSATALLAKVREVLDR